MGLFSRSSNNNGEIDFKRLRSDLMDEYGLSAKTVVPRILEIL